MFAGYHSIHCMDTHNASIRNNLNLFSFSQEILVLHFFHLTVNRQNPHEIKVSFYVMLVFISCWHDLVHAGTIYFMLARFISCWHDLFHAGTIYFMLARFISCWHDLFHAGTIYFMLARFTSCWHNLFHAGYFWR